MRKSGWIMHFLRTTSPFTFTKQKDRNIKCPDPSILTKEDPYFFVNTILSILKLPLEVAIAILFLPAVRYTSLVTVL